MKTFYINLRFSNFDGKGTANCSQRRHQDFPDKSVDVALNAVAGSMIQLTADAQPWPVEVTKKDVILINCDQVNEVEFSDEPAPVYIPLDNGVADTGKFSDSFVFLFAKNIIIKEWKLTFLSII